MKKVIKLTESDLERIVRRVIEEQYAGVAFGAEQNGLRIKKVEATEQTQPGVTGGAPVDKKQIYNGDIAKINQYLPVNTEQFKPVLAIAKEPGNDNMQTFNQYQDVIKQVQELLPKFNPKGYRESMNSYWERYTPITGIPGSTQSYKKALISVMQDIINVKNGLVYLASEKAGFPRPKPSWIKDNFQLEQLNAIGKQIGIV